MAENTEVSGDFRKWILLAAMGVGTGLVMLDESVIGVALPSLRQDLGLTKIGSHWVISSYMLVFAATTAAAGKFGDIIGFKKLMALGITVFGVTSLIAGFAENGALLIAARSFQGIGAAIIMPSSMAMIMMVFDEEKRGIAVGVSATVGSCFLALGPLIGGLLTEFLSWRWIFWINIPISLFIMCIVLWLWENPPRSQPTEAFDKRGFFSLVFGLGLLVFAIMQGPDWGWTHEIVLSSFACGGALLAFFVMIELWQKSPLININLFGLAPFSASVFVLFTAQYCKITIVVFGALFLQEKLGMTPLTAGLALLVAVVGFLVLSPVVGWLADRYEPRPLVLGGLTVATAAMFWNGFSPGEESYLMILPGLILWGIGMPFCYSPTLRIMANSVPDEEQGEIGGIFVSARVLGSVLSMALGSSLLLMTGGYEAVFLLTASIMLVALIFAGISIGRQER